MDFRKMKYKTCISVGEKTPRKVLQTVNAALKKSEYVELRFDFLPIEKIPEVLEMVKKDLRRIVCTLRPKTEGGKFAGNEKERLSILKLIAEYNPFLLDVEFKTLSKNQDLVKYLRLSKVNLLVSWHDFKKTPSSDELSRKIKQMSKFSKNVKIVGTAKNTKESTRMLELYKKNKQIKLISFSMGDMGRISRILCLYLGSPFTYVALKKAIAPGQFSVDDVKKIINLK